MSVWSKRRQLVYGGTTILLFTILVIFLLFKFFYRAPSCFDGKQNGTETGLDCGGACTKLCPSAFVTPSNKWVRFEQVATGVYNVAAYIVNPNTKVGASAVPYRIELFNRKGNFIGSYTDTLTLSPNRNSLAYRSLVKTGSEVPFQASFSFLDIPDWKEQKDKVSSVLIVDKKYTETVNGSTLTVTLKNNSVESLDNLFVYVILYNSENNVIGFSKTSIDHIGPGEIKLAPYTWPQKHPGVITIEVLPVAE